MVDDIGTVYRDFNNINDPASGDYEPEKARIRKLLRDIRALSGQAVTKGTLAELTAVTPPTENYMGIVLDDPDPTNNGYYYRDAAAWVFGRPFPDTFAEVALSGSGTAQAGAVDVGVNPSGVEVFYARVTTPNTGPMTLSISGETARQVVNLAGNPLSAGEWTGMVMFFLNDDGDYQLLIDAGAAAAAAQSATDAQTALAQFLSHFLGDFADDAAAATAAGTPEEGQFYWNTASKVFRYFDGTTWQAFPYATVPDGTIVDAQVAEGAGIASSKIAYLLSATDAQTRTLADKLTDLVSIKDFGAKADGITVTGDTTITSGAAALLVVGASFVASDVGKAIKVPGAGAAGAALYSTISAVTDSENVTLADTASTSLAAVSTAVLYFTDDTAAINAALASGKTLLVPTGQYHITDSLLKDVPGTGIYGQSTPYFGAVSEIKMVSATPKPVFITEEEGHTFLNLKITGQSTAVGSIGIQVGPSSGFADRDVYISNCFINTTQDCVYSYGRGVYIEDSRLVATGNCLNVNWPDPFTPTGGVDDTAETGFRAIYLRNCRLQAIAGRIVRNVGANAANLDGLTLVGNYVDGRNGVIYGSVRNGNVSANTFVHSSAIMFLLDNVDGLTITGNVFAGMHDSTGNVTTPHEADIENIVYLNSGFTAKGITFSGNTVNNLYKDGFFLNGTWSDINISGNTFLDALRGNNDASLAPSQYGIVRTNTAGSGLVFANNVCEVGDYTRNGYLVNSGGSAVENWVVQGNTYDPDHIGETNLASGTFTPLLTTNGTGFTSVTYSALRGGKYERIGRTVFVQFHMRTEAITLGGASGNIQIDLNDLPFTCGASSGATGNGSAPISIGTSLNWTNGPIAGQLRPGEKRIDLFKRASTTSNIANLTTGDVATGASGNILQVSLTFIAG